MGEAFKKWPFLRITCGFAVVFFEGWGLTGVIKKSKFAKRGVWCRFYIITRM